jgi:heat shock protein HtpX
MSAQGIVDLGALTRGLHRAGAERVTVSLSPLTGDLQLPAPWEKSTDKKYGDYIYYSTSADDSDVPPPTEVRLGTPWTPRALALPFGFILFGPALLSLWLRRRAERQGAVEQAAIWAHWILNGSWLYWITAVSPDDFAALVIRMNLPGGVMTFLAGVLLCAGPPLVATASCTAILARPDGESGTARLVRLSVAHNAILMVPLGMFFVGASIFEGGSGTILSAVGAYLVYRVLSWAVTMWSIGGLETLSRGELLDRAKEIGQRAGVVLNGLYIFGNPSPREANAYALGGRMVALTRGLVERLTRRELDAIVAHEVGHLRGAHGFWRLSGLWVYILLSGPLTNLLAKAHVPPVILATPIIPFAYIMLAGRLSRKHEYSADAKAAELTGDPEGAIAGLARVSRLTNSPVSWGGVQGSILSHPSMRDRVLSLARRFGVAEDRALALLHDPDLLTSEVPAELRHYRLPVECSAPDLLFSTSRKESFNMWGGWAANLGLVAITLAASYVPFKLWPQYFIFCLPLIIVTSARLFLSFSDWVERLFVIRLRRELMARVKPGGDVTFVGLTPGSKVITVDAHNYWDIGFLSFDMDRLTYTGERTSFSIPRTAVTEVSIGKGPIAWDRTYAAVIRYSGGAINLVRPDMGLSGLLARQLARKVKLWRITGGEMAGDAESISVTGPGVAVIESSFMRGWRAVRVHGVRAFMLMIGMVFLLSLQPSHWTPVTAFLPFLVPVSYLFAIGPCFFRRAPRSANLAPAAAPSTATT